MKVRAITDGKYGQLSGLCLFCLCIYMGAGARKPEASPSCHNSHHGLEWTLGGWSVSTHPVRLAIIKLSKQDNCREL